MRHGFTLVELSIVLVVLGLLTGGILAGQSLIRAAELRSVTTDLSKYATAHVSFEDKYAAIPGDMRDAVRYWGAADGTTGESLACLTVDSRTLADTKRTCNGDGNGRIDPIATSHETYRYWQHLANAGLVEGSFSGVTGPTGGGDPGSNLPRSRLAKLSIGSGWWPAGNATGIHSGSTYEFDGYYGNIYTIQGPRDTTFVPPQARIMRPQEMFNIDTKLDDGKPAIGKFRARKGYGCTFDDATPTPQYSLGSTDMVCNGVFSL